jgi:hypothetical protein
MGEDEMYICGECVFRRLNPVERAIYAFGREVGSFYEEVHLCEIKEPKPQYIAVVVDENKRKIEQYSARNPSKLEKNMNVLDECKDIYYLCFGDLSNFFPEKCFKDKKVFALRNDVMILLLNIPKEFITNKNRKNIEWKGKLNAYLVDSEENH